MIECVRSDPPISIGKLRSWRWASWVITLLVRVWRVYRGGLTMAHSPSGVATPTTWMSFPPRVFSMSRRSGRPDGLPDRG